MGIGNKMSIISCNFFNQGEDILFVLIDSAGCTDVVLVCCGISIRKLEEKGIEGKLSWN